MSTDERRKSVADIRDNSFDQIKESLKSVSVKAMSALYLSKVATQESTHGLLKPVKNRRLDTISALFFPVLDFFF